MESRQTQRAGLEDHPTADRSLPAFVDWVLGALVALAGLALIVGGSVLTFVVDREMIAEQIEDGTATVMVGTTELTDAEQIELAEAVVSWTGVGLLVTGLTLALIGIGYAVVKHRAHSRVPEGESRSNYSTFALLGAVLTVVLSFLPFSPALGGAVSGYLERGESNRTISIGALAGLLPMLPLLAILVFVLGGVVAGLVAVDQAGMSIVVGAVLFFTLMFVAIIGAGLGALGGYVGGQIAESRDSSN